MLSSSRSRRLLALIGLGLSLVVGAIAVISSGEQGPLAPHDAPALEQPRGPATLELTPRPEMEPEEGRPESRSIRVEVVRGYEDEVVSGAEVRVVGQEGLPRKTRTGEDGVARFDGLPEGLLHVVAIADGYAISEKEKVSEEWNPDGKVLIRLEPAGPLHGQVVDAADGRPVADVKVTALEGGALCMNPFPAQRLGRVFGTATTEGDGRFVVGGVSRQPFCSLRLVRVQAPGYRTLWKVAPPDGEDSQFIIRLVPGGSIRGTVTGAQGKPVPGARVVCLLAGPWDFDPTLYEDYVGLPDRFTNHVEWAGQEAAVHVVEDAWAALTATTDTEGRYEIHGLGSGERYAVAARAPGHAPSGRTYPVRLTSETRQKQVDLALRKPCRLTVFCQDAQGKPWPGISIQIEPNRHGPDIAEQETDERGFARFNDLTPGEFNVRAHEYRGGGGTLVKYQGRAGERNLTLTVDAEQPEPRPSRPESAEPDAPEEAAEPAPPTQEREPTLIARLAVPDGVAPPKYVTMSGLYKGGGGHGGIEWTPDGTGTVLVEWFWDNLRYTFVVEAPGFLPIRREVKRALGSIFDLGTLTLDPGETLRGVVRKPDGTPLPGVSVEVSHPARASGVGSSFWSRISEPEEAFTREPETAADGSFTLSGLPREAVSIEMRDPRFLPFHMRVQALPLKAPLDLVVDLGSVLHVRAEDQGGHRATRRYVNIIQGAEGTDSAAWGRTNVEGVFAARLKPGTYRIEVGTLNSGEEDKATHIVELDAGVVREVRIVAPEIK